MSSVVNEYRFHHRGHREIANQKSQILKCNRLPGLQIPRIDNHSLTDAEAGFYLYPIRAAATGGYGFLDRFSVFHDTLSMPAKVISALLGIVTAVFV